MGISPWFPQYTNDWLGSASVTTQNIAEEGAYHRLLCFAWNDPDCTIPADVDALKVLAKINTFAGAQLVDIAKVLKCFVPHRTKAGRLINPRLYEEWRKTKALLKSKSQAGKKGMRTRWAKQRYNTVITEGITKHNQSESESESESESREKKKIKTLSSPVGDSTSEVSSEFETFWEAYPKRNGKRIGKAKTQGLFNRLVPTDQVLCVQAANNYARSDGAVRGFSKDPERFLAKDFWREWIEPETPQASLAPRKPLTPFQSMMQRAAAAAEAAKHG